MKKINNTILIFGIITIFSCSNNNDNLKGYWRDYNEKYPDCYNTMHISDTSILLDEIYLGWVYQLKYENDKVILPFDKFNEFFSDYKVIADTVFYQENKVWVKYDYTTKRFLDDISNGVPMVHVVPELINQEEEYFDLDTTFWPTLHIGKVKDCFRSKLNDSTYNYKGYYIQINDVFGDIEDVIYWANKTTDLIFNVDKDVAEEVSKMIIIEFHKSQKYMRFYKTYADTLNKKLKVKRINTNHIINQ